MLLVQQYLMNHSFGDLAKEHGVYCSFSKSGHKWSLNYDQIEAKEDDLLAQECRGLILSCDTGVSLLSQSLTLHGQKISYDHLCPGKTQILAYPMRRFFNHGQGAAAQIDWSDPGLSILEKLDGTLCIVYWDPYKDQFGVDGWCVATRSVCEADLPMDNGIFTFRTLFEKAVQETLGYDFGVLHSHLDKSYTYCFELTTPYNRVVVNYPTSRVTLLAARNLKTMKEGFPHQLGIATVLGVPVVQTYNYTTISELVDWVSTLNPMQHEGVVVRDSNFNRIKVKNAAYVAYNKLNDRLGTSERNCMEIILQEKDDDVIAFLPEEIVKNISKLKVGLMQIIKNHDFAYKSILSAMKISKKCDKKTFALMVQDLVKAHPDTIWGAPLFQMFDKKCSSMKGFIQQNRKDGTWGDNFLERILQLAKQA